MNRQIIARIHAALALAAIITMSSCGQEEKETGPQAVRFTSSVAGMKDEAPISRAANAAWAQGDAIGIFMVEAGTTTISEGVENYKYTAPASGTTFTAATAADEIYFPVDGSLVDFIAYYPHTTTNLTDFVYTVNVATQTSQAAIDLLYSNNAKAKSKTNTNVPLTFEHKLVKLVLETLPGDGLTTTDLAGMAVSIKGMNTRNTFDLETGTLGTTPGTPAAITPYTAASGTRYEAIVLPRTVATLGDVSVEFTINGDVFTWKVDAATEFAAGSEYTYIVTIKRTGVQVTGTITPWTSVTARNVTAD